MSMLAQFLKHKELTKMNASNLALVFTPNLLRKKEKLSLMTVLSDQARAQFIVETMIKRYREILERVG